MSGFLSELSTLFMLAGEQLGNKSLLRWAKLMRGVI
jgi:hypothetical protein